MRCVHVRSSRGSWRGLVIWLVSAVMVLTVAACNRKPVAESSSSSTATSSAEPSSEPTASHPAGRLITSLDEIQVSGDAGKAPTVTAQWPLAIEKTQSKVLVPGQGAAISDTNQTIEFNYVGINAATGKAFDSSFKQDRPLYASLSHLIPGFANLVGKHVGDRVLLAVAPADGYSSGVPQIDIQAGDTIVFVVDVLAVPLSGPAGTPVPPAAGLPAVSDNNGVPSIMMPGGNPPSTLQIQPLIKGNGVAVKATDSVTVNYVAYNWATGQQIDSTYGASAQTGLLSTLIPGWKTGLVDQTVGSRMLLVVPPSDAYPEGNATPSISPGTTIVYVIDILFAKPAQSQ